MRPPQRLGSPYINQRNFKIAIVAIGLLIVLGFFGYEFKFLRSPNLEISSPNRDITTEATVFDVRGRTDKDSDLTMNGRSLYSGETGEFTERVYLVRGVNALEFVAGNRYGKTTTITRYIIVQ